MADGVNVTKIPKIKAKTNNPSIRLNSSSQPHISSPARLLSSLSREVISSTALLPPEGGGGHGLLVCFCFCLAFVCARKIYACPACTERPAPLPARHGPNENRRIKIISSGPHRCAEVARQRSVVRRVATPVHVCIPICTRRRGIPGCIIDKGNQVNH